MEWTNKTIGDIAFVTKLAGFEHTKYIQGNCIHERKDDSFIPLFIGKTVRDGRIDKNFDWYIPKSIADQLPRSFLKRKCLVLPYVGTIGDLAVFDASYDALLGSNIAKIELNPNCGYSEEFIYYYLKSPRGQTVLLKDEQGGIQKNITMEAIRNVLLPDVDEDNQKKIVSVLSALDDKIALNKKMNQKLEAMAKRLYDYWFVQYDFPDKNGHPYKTTGGPMTYNPTLKREIPEGWEVLPIREILDKYKTTKKFNTSDYKTNGKYPIVDQDTSTFIAGYTDDDDVLKRFPAVLFGDHSTCVKFLNFEFGRGADGTQILYSKNERIHQFYLYMAIKSMSIPNPGYARHFKFLKEMPIILPCQKLADEYQKRMEPIYAAITKVDLESRAIIRLRDKLLPLLMNGQVVVG